MRTICHDDRNWAENWLNPKLLDFGAIPQEANPKSKTLIAGGTKWGDETKAAITINGPAHSLQYKDWIG